MIKCYIGLGGVACKTLKDFYNENSKLENARFIYFDTDAIVLTYNNEKEYFFYCPDFPYGTGHCRTFGKEYFRKLVYTGKVPHFFDEFYSVESIELIFLTTTFSFYIVPFPARKSMAF